MFVRTKSAFTLYENLRELEKSWLFQIVIKITTA